MIDTFKRLVDRLDSDRVIWRFDPMVLTDRISNDDLLEKVERIGNQLKGYTKKLVFSFADILEYKKVKANLEKNHINYRLFEKDDMEYLARGLMGLNKYTCPHKCEYCYANSSKMIAEANYNQHKLNPYFESIVGM